MHYKTLSLINIDTIFHSTRPCTFTQRNYHDRDSFDSREAAIENLSDFVWNLPTRQKWKKLKEKYLATNPCERDEWYVIGSYPEDNESASTEGRLGDIRGRPDERDLREVEERVREILS